ncbi:MAG: TonB family protein [Candidatus Omnitrophota bacterium]
MKKISLALFLILCFSFAFSLKGHALINGNEELRLYMGEVKVISVRNPTRVAIGNPGVADITAVSKVDLTLTPKSAGSTTLVVWDNYGEQSYNVKVFTEDMSKIKARVDNILGQLGAQGVFSQAQDEEGKVFLLGKAKNEAEKNKVISALGTLKDKIVDLISVRDEEAVIEIDVQIFEINRGAEKRLGFEWPETISLSEVAESVPGISAEGATSWAKLFKLGSVTRTTYDLTFDALVKEGNARLLSRPRLACLSGKSAKLVVGGEVPILSGSVTPGTSGAGTTGATTGGSVEYKDYGIVLNINPAVNDQGNINLKLNVEVSELGAQVKTDYALAYTFFKRSADTEIILEDGQVMAIGGLIKQKTIEEMQKFPWLGDIPILGMFFRHKVTAKGGALATSDGSPSSPASSREDVELFITLTPRIVNQEGAAKRDKKTVASKPQIEREGVKDPVYRYSQLIQVRILEGLIYPPAAKGSGFQGITTLSLKLSYKGDLLESKIQSSSGYKVLDDNALRAAKRASPYPPFPPAITERELWVNIPIAYQLD